MMLNIIHDTVTKGNVPFTVLHLCMTTPSGNFRPCNCSYE